MYISSASDTESIFQFTYTSEQIYKYARCNYSENCYLINEISYFRDLECHQTDSRVSQVEKHSCTRMYSLRTLAFSDRSNDNGDGKNSFTDRDRRFEKVTGT
jgi:hypothetical protein